MKFYSQFPKWCNVSVEKVRHAPMITNIKKVPKTTRFFHRYFFHRYYFVYLTHSKKPYDVIKMGNFINYLRTSITITYLKIIKIEALLFFRIPQIYYDFFLNSFITFHTDMSQIHQGLFSSQPHDSLLILVMNHMSCKVA